MWPSCWCETESPHIGRGEEDRKPRIDALFDLPHSVRYARQAKGFQSHGRLDSRTFLSRVDVTAEAKYGVDRDFIVKGIRSFKLEYRAGAMWGNPYLRILRSQLEKYIAEELGEDYLVRANAQTELRKIKKEISDLKKRQQRASIPKGRS